MQSKNALSNLKNRYVAVLKKCALINVFGTLAIATMCAMPATAFSATNPEGVTTDILEAAGTDTTLNNYGTLTGKRFTPAGFFPMTVGMFAHTTGDKNFNLTNNGNINISSTDNDALGMSATIKGNGNNTLINNSKINVISTGNGIFGMYAQILYNGNGNGSNKLNNSGSIVVKGNDYIYGMYAYEDETNNHVFSNSGSIEASGNKYIYGIAGEGRANYTIINSGIINVSGNDVVRGINLSGNSFRKSIYLLNNTGIITAKATTGSAFEAYARDDDYSVGTWATTLRTWTPTDAVFGGDSGVSVNLANSTLVFRPGTEADGFKFGTEYDLTNLVSINNTATATQFGTVATEVPFLKAVVTGGNSTDTAKVRLDTNINSDTTPGSVSAQGNLALVQGQMSNITRKLLQTKYNEIYIDLVSDNGNSGIAAGSEAEQNKWTAFLTPYGSLTNNSEYNFDGSQMGVTGGASYNFSEKFSLGAHFDFNYAEFDADIMDMDSDSTSYAFGLHANYNIMPQWYVSAQATGSISQIENEYSLTTGTSTKADYDSQALYLALNSGYVFEVAKGHTFTPQVGFSYLNMHADSYDINWASAYSMYNMQYDSTSYSAFYADLNLNWRSAWQFENNNALALLASVGVRQNLSGSDIDSDFRVFGTEYSTRSSADDTTFLTDLGLEWSKNNFSLSLNYNGEYGSEQQVHGGAIEFKYMF